MQDQFRYLFTPFKIGSLTIKNRICTSGHGTLFADKDHILDERYVEYQRARAKGGAGLVITGMMDVMFNCRNLIAQQEVCDEKVVPMFKKLSEAVHEHGTKVFVQLNHTGRETDIELTRLPSWAPSPVPDISFFREVPKEMESEDIQEVVQAFANAAGYAKEGGLDGVEIHGASGYLLGQFMSPSSNRRTDEYGGSLRNRLRITFEVIDGIRERVGADFVVGIRIPGDEMTVGGNNSEDMKEIAKELEATGKIDYIHTGLSFYEGVFSVGFGMHLPLGFYTPYAAGFKEVVDLPIINTFRINDPVQAEGILANGQADMVGMTRALIADPQLPNKAREGRLDEIRTCIACDQGCLGRIFKQKPMSCLQNAAVGLEKEIGTLEPTTDKKKVLIVGGGPAGMEAARVARMRGHEVVLYEKEQVLGGQVNLAAKVSIREEFGGCVRYLGKQMEILGVTVNLGVEVTPELIEEVNPDAVILATGSSPQKPAIPGAEQANVVTEWDVLQETAEVGQKVVVVDGGEGHWRCCSIAEHLAEQGKQVEVITPLMFVGMEAASTADLGPYYFRVRGKGAEFAPSTAITEISGSTVVALDIFANRERKIEGVDTVVLVSANRANTELYQRLKGKIKELHIIGDCVAPRKAIDAIYEGYTLGRTL